jgi:hypothetical protein
MVRLQPEMIDQIDNWRRDQEDLPSRAEAMRRLAEVGLMTKGKAR